MNVFDRYGIKEVADVSFYKINDDGTPGDLVLYLDSLKVSTIEQTAENTSARGGKGNPELISWDYGREITLTLEDALYSIKSMQVMFGAENSTAEATAIKKTVRIADVDGEKFKIGKESYPAQNITYLGADGKATEKSAAVYASGEITIAGTKITIDADTFPGTYYITGETYARNETTGDDEGFQFIIPKAKLQSEITLTMEAEGDPSTFNMTVKALRPSNGRGMIELVQY